MRRTGTRPLPRSVARQRTNAVALPEWVAPQLTQLVEAAPEGNAWLMKSNMTATACMRGSTVARSGS